MIDFRHYRPGDEAQVTSLFAQVFDRPMSSDFWRWRFLEHPLPTPLMVLAFEGDTLVANYAASHAPLQTHGEVIPACLSMTTMTHPGWRGQKLFERTAEALYETLPSLGIRAVYGFPNTISHTLFRYKVGWSDYYDIPTLCLDVGSLASVPSVDGSVRIIPSIDQRFTQFCRAISAGLPICGYRDASILRWRVDLNPDHTYTRFVLDEGAEIAGYAITKLYGDEILDLVELRAAGPSVAKALINAVISHAASAKRSRIATWCLPSEDHRIPLEMAGFKAAAPVTYFGGRVFGEMPADLTDSRLWRVSMLDSDLY